VNTYFKKEPKKIGDYKRMCRSSHEIFNAIKAWEEKIIKTELKDEPSRYAEM